MKKQLAMQEYIETCKKFDTTQRLGQFFYNEYLSGTALENDAQELFYCDDKEFPKVFPKFFRLV